VADWVLVDFGDRAQLLPATGDPKAQLTRGVRERQCPNAIGRNSRFLATNFLDPTGGHMERV